jgi:hypothetical protein
MKVADEVINADHFLMKLWFISVSVLSAKTQIYQQGLMAAKMRMLSMTWMSLWTFMYICLPWNNFQRIRKYKSM